MLIKKYYTISEIQQILAVPSYKLRYLEKITDKLNVFRIKGRRYYKAKDLEFLKRHLSCQDKENHNIVGTIASTPNQLNDINDRIDALIYKFNKLAKEISLNC